MMNKFTVLFIISFLILNSFAVDRSKFKTCDQSGFCKRNRGNALDGGQFDLVKNSIKLDGSSLVGKLISSKQGYEGKTLEFTINVLKNGILRLQMDEENKVKQRYRVKDILLEQENIKFEYNQAKRELKWGRNSAIIGESPFSLAVYEGGEKIISYNERNLMNWEFLGKEGEHSESFSSHTDSVPNGPSSIAMDVTFFQTDNVYGIPSHATSLSLKPTKGKDITSDPYRLYNLDVFEYELDNPMALYGHIPYLISHNDVRTVGVFWLNSAEMWVDIEKNTEGFFGSSHSTSSHWFAESGVVDLFFIVGPTPADLFSQYSALTGTQDLPPLYSIAYHQCKWNYRTENEVQDIDESFDKVDIPYDVIWLDIEHTDGKRYFTWDNYNFQHPEIMLDKIASKGRKMVTIVDPHIKRDDNYYVHKEATTNGFYVKNKDGGDYEGWCWPGSSSWPDFTRNDVSTWWGTKFQYDNYKGSSNNLLIWNDMNEPSVFSGPEITMQKDVKHGEWEHRDVHNLYGLTVHNATANGLINRNPSKNIRPFVLSRAFFAGTQRIGAIWTGDNKADWGHLAYSQPMLLSIGLTGVTFSGADVGGFFGDPDEELLTRWYQAGAFQPFFRAHAHLDAKRREPFLYEEPHRSIMRNAILERYFLLPYWYTCFYQAYKTGVPTMRPLWVEYPKNAKTFNLDDQFLVGDSILVKPVTKAGTTSMDVFLPDEDIFYDYSNFRKYSGNTVVKTPLDRIVAFYRGGKIVPRQQRVRRSSTQMKDDPYTLVVALNKKGSAAGEIYFDDFISFDFRKGLYHHRSFSFQNNSLQSKLISGDYKSTNEIERIIVVGLSSKPSKVTSGSRSLDFDFENNVLTIRKPSLRISEDFVVTLN